MLSTPQLNDADVFLLATPLLLALIAGFFRLDTQLATRKAARAIRRQPVAIAVKDPAAMMTDPDGRPWD